MTMLIERQQGGTNISATARIITRPTFSSVGTQEGVAVVSWIVDTSHRMPGEAAIQLGRTASGDPLPKRGEQLRVIVDGYRYRNPSLFAFDFRTTPIAGSDDGDFADAWQVDVTFRQPVWGQDEVPSRAHLPPWQRVTETKWDFLDVPDQTTKGRRVSNVTNGTLEPDIITMVNTADHPYPAVAKPRRVLVARLLFNSLLPDAAIRISEVFENTTNKEPFKLMGRSIAKHHARFLSVEQWDGGWYDGVKYYRLEERIEVAKTPYYETRPSEGPFYKNGQDKIRRIPERDGMLIPGPFKLDEDGGLETESNPGVDTNYLVLTEFSYGTKKADV